MQGGCFSISSLGGIGGTAFTPIINAPEVAILGVSKSATKPVWDGKRVRAAARWLPLSLSYDHRVIDGAGGGAVHRVSRGAARRHAPGDAMSTVEVKVPDIGDFKDIPVIEVFVKPGDKVAAEDSLVTLESDKATMDVPSPAAGVVKEVKVKLGDKVSEGSLIVVLESDAAGSRRREGSRDATAAAPAAAAARRRRPPRLQLAKPAPPAGSRRFRVPPPTPARRTSSAEMLVLGAGTRRLQRRRSARADLGMKTVLVERYRDRWAACASTSAAFRRRRCCTSRP